MRKFSVLLLTWLVLLFTKSYAQCPPVSYTLYDTVCAGVSSHGYNATGVYIDTFDLGAGCDSIRTLDLTVFPNVIPSGSKFNTANNGSGGVLNAGNQDLNWKVSLNLTGPFNPAIVMNNPPANYASGNYLDVSWISHNMNGNHGGSLDYFYRLDFFLPCEDTCGTSMALDSAFCLSLDMWADNSIYDIYVNGVSQNATIPNIPVANPYTFLGFNQAEVITTTFCDGWQPGLNTIIVHISSGAPTAAFLCQISANAPIDFLPDAAFETENNGTIAGTSAVDTGCNPYEITFINNSSLSHTYLWDFGDGNTSTDISPSHVYHYSGEYEVTLFAHRGCDVDSIKMTVAVLESPSDTVDVFSCEGEIYSVNGIILDTSGFYSFKFPLSFGMCDSVSHMNFKKIPSPKINYSENLIIAASCKGKDNGSAFILKHFDDTATYTYTWYDNNGAIISQNDTLTNAPAGFYTLEAESSANGCLTTIQFNISQEQVSFTSDTLICAETDIIFTNTSDPHMTSYWNLGNGIVTDEVNPTTEYLAPGNYEIMLVGRGNGCVDTAYKTIIVDPIVSNLWVELEPREICKGEDVWMTAHVGNTAVNLRWDYGDLTGTTTPTQRMQHYYDQAGVHYVNLTADFRVCPQLSFEDSVIVHDLPKVSIGADSSLCLGSEPLLLANRSHQIGYRYNWSTGDTMRSTRATHHGNYWVRVKNQFGCTNSETITIEKDCYVDIPNIFTPNNDGVNDYFFPRQYLSSGITRFRLAVFNRWGQEMFVTHNIDGRGWDGKLNGTDQPAGVYVYLIEVVYHNGKAEQYRGNVTLLR